MVIRQARTWQDSASRGWIPPDAGQDTNPDHFGGGCADHDRRVAEEAVEFLSGPQSNPDSLGR